MSDFNSKEFGNKLRELRKSKGLSQDNLANKLNISRTTIGRFESGEMIPNAQIIKELCEILGVYSTELFEMDYKIKNKDDIKNPFKANCLYMYFNAWSDVMLDIPAFYLIYTNKSSIIYIYLFVGLHGLIFLYKNPNPS